MHFCKMEATEIGNSNRKSEKESKRKPTADGIKNVRGFKFGHPCLKSRHTRNSGVWLPRVNMGDYSRVVHVTAGGLLAVPDVDDTRGNSKILRPQLFKSGTRNAWWTASSARC